MIPRPELLEAVNKALKRSEVTLLLGPRQCGKTTLARMVRGDHAAGSYFDLEDPADLLSLEEPMSALRPLKGLVIIDEIQRRPDLFPVLRVLVDRRPRRSRFLILGSASPVMIRQASESLAGRVEIVEMGGFDLAEVGVRHLNKLWIRGGFPPSFLARNQESSRAWRQNMIRTLLERDIPQLNLNLPAMTLHRFWSMLAHYHGQTWNASEIGRSLGISDVTTRRYLDVLTGTYMVRQLLPWFENLKKRQVKTPKIYLRDSGVAHTILGISTYRDVLSHPKCGASWEGFALEQVLRLFPGTQAYFWATHGVAELDLFVLQGPKRLGFEFKFNDAPRLTKSMQIALTDLRLSRLAVIYPGGKAYDLASKVRAVPLVQLQQELQR